MKSRASHLPLEQLTALAFVARAPESPVSDEEAQAYAHLASCDRCAGELARLTLDADLLRGHAHAEADALFDDAMLETQRTRILDRLSHVGQLARVLAFPRTTRDVTAPVSGGTRRWVSVAAAAGLIIGLVAGQMLHFVPRPPVTPRDDGASIVSSVPPPSRIRPAVATIVLTDDELMEEVESSLEVRGAFALRAIDALTPTAADQLAYGR